MTSDLPASAVPTELPDLTVEGTILEPSIQPEQLAGGDAREHFRAGRRREMIAGRRAFTGDTGQA
jgi:hypothetical protein